MNYTQPSRVTQPQEALSIELTWRAPSPILSPLQYHFDADDTRASSYTPLKSSLAIDSYTRLHVPRPRTTLAMARHSSSSTLNSDVTCDNLYAEHAESMNYWNPYDNVVQSAAFGTLRLLTGNATDRCGPDVDVVTRAFRQRYRQEMGRTGEDFFFKLGKMSRSYEGSSSMFTELIDAGIVSACGDDPSLYEVCDATPLTEEKFSELFARAAVDRQDFGEGFAYWGAIVVNAWRHAGQFDLFELIDIYRLDCNKSAFRTPFAMDLYDGGNTDKIIRDAYTGWNPLYHARPVPAHDIAARHLRVAQARASCAATIDAYDDCKMRAAAYNFA